MPIEATSSAGWLEGLFNRPSESLATREQIAKEGMEWLESRSATASKAIFSYRPGTRARSSRS
jgi:hypothetical protein